MAKRGDGRLALVTGGGGGIGFEIAHQLGLAGVTVLLSDIAGAEAAADTLKGRGMDVHPMVLDVTDHAAIGQAAAKIEQQFGHLDILVNNAAFMPEQTGLPSESSPENLRRAFETNVFGPVWMIQAFLPLLRKSSAGRIVNICSDFGSLHRQTDAEDRTFANRMLAYASSKAALNMVTVMFAKELWDTGIKVNGVYPGFTATPGTNFGGQSPEVPAKVAVELALLDDDGPTCTVQGCIRPALW